MLNPTFSIITPVYNDKMYIKSAVESVLCQDYDDFEYIIVDDGSNDGTEQEVDELSALDDRIHVIHQKNQWIYASYNNGIRLANGKYILILNSDDKLYPGILKRAAEIIKCNGDLDVLWSILVINKCDKDQNIIEEDCLNVISYFKEDVLFDQANFRHKWLDLYKALVVKNPINFYKREIMLQHPFRNDEYGADVFFNIEIAPLINNSYLIHQPAYQYFEYIDSNRINISGNENYYSYEHAMFNEILDKVIELMASWNMNTFERRLFLYNERLALLQKEFNSLKGQKCKKDWRQKVNEGLNYFDDIIYKCALNTDTIEKVTAMILSSVKEILLNEFAKNVNEMKAVLSVFEIIAVMEAEGKDFYTIRAKVQNTLNV